MKRCVSTPGDVPVDAAAQPGGAVALQVGVVTALATLAPVTCHVRRHLRVTCHVRRHVPVTRDVLHGDLEPLVLGHGGEVSVGQRQALLGHQLGALQQVSSTECS